MGPPSCCADPARRENRCPALVQSRAAGVTLWNTAGRTAPCAPPVRRQRRRGPRGGAGAGAAPDAATVADAWRALCACPRSTWSTWAASRKARAAPNCWTAGSASKRHGRCPLVFIGKGLRGRATSAACAWPAGSTRPTATRWWPCRRAVMPSRHESRRWCWLEPSRSACRRLPTATANRCPTTWPPRCRRVLSRRPRLRAACARIGRRTTSAAASARPPPLSGGTRCGATRCRRLAGRGIEPRRLSRFGETGTLICPYSPCTPEHMTSRPFLLLLPSLQPSHYIADVGAQRAGADDPDWHCGSSTTPATRRRR